MSLYINQKKHEAIYKNEKAIKQPNQSFFIHNNMQEMIKEQQNINRTLHQSFNSLKNRYEHQESKSFEILSQLKELNTNQLSRKDITEQLIVIRELSQTANQKTEDYEAVTHELIPKIEEQLELQKQTQTEILNQKETQKEVISRLDNQEARTEKIIREMNHFRSLLFERTNYVTEKIEKGYHLTSAYIHHVLLNRDKLPLSFMLFQKQEQGKK